MRLAIMQWEEKWKAMTSELGGDAKIPDLRRMSALLEICPKDVKEQMLMRLDKIGENYESFKAKVISYTTNKAEEHVRYVRSPSNRSTSRAFNVICGRTCIARQMSRN